MIHLQYLFCFLGNFDLNIQLFSMIWIFSFVEVHFKMKLLVVLTVIDLL